MSEGRFELQHVLWSHLAVRLTNSSVLFLLLRLRLLLKQEACFLLGCIQSLTNQDITWSKYVA